MQMLGWGTEGFGIRCRVEGIFGWVQDIEWERDSFMSYLEDVLRPLVSDSCCQYDRRLPKP